MKKVKYLNLKLTNLESQKQKYKLSDETSFLEFIKLKSIISKQKKVSKALEKCISIGNEINFWYDSLNKSWIQNPNISPRKYCRLEEHAAYKKDLKLYKLGLTDQKPISPFFQKIHIINNSIKEKLSPILKKFHSKIPKIDISNFILIKKVRNFKSNVLSPQINNIAINTAKVGIKGYKKIQANCRYIHNSINSKNTFSYIRNIINEANNQISMSEKQRLFRESLKVPSTYFMSDSPSYFENYKSSAYFKPEKTVHFEISKSKINMTSYNKKSKEDILELSL